MKGDVIIEKKYTVVIIPQFLRPSGQSIESLLRRTNYTKEKALNPTLHSDKNVHRLIPLLNNSIENKVNETVDYSLSENQIGCGYCIHEPVHNINKAKYCSNFKHFKS